MGMVSIGPSKRKKLSAVRRRISPGPDETPPEDGPEPSGHSQHDVSRQLFGARTDRDTDDFEGQWKDLEAQWPNEPSANQAARSDAGRGRRASDADPYYNPAHDPYAQVWTDGHGASEDERAQRQNMARQDYLEHPTPPEPMPPPRPAQPSLREALADLQAGVETTPRGSVPPVPRPARPPSPWGDAPREPEVTPRQSGITQSRPSPQPPSPSQPRTEPAARDSGRVSASAPADIPPRPQPRAYVPPPQRAERAPRPEPEADPRPDESHAGSEPAPDQHHDEAPEHRAEAPRPQGARLGARLRQIGPERTEQPPQRPARETRPPQPWSSRAVAPRPPAGAAPPRPPLPRRPAAADGDDGPHDVFAGALESVKQALIATGVFSMFANILTLAGPLYMLQVYDRVLTSGSVPTLVALTVLLVVLYGALGLLEMLRGQILNRIAGRLDSQLGPATLEAMPRHRLATGKGINDEPLRDLSTLRSFISGSGPGTFFDLPWAPIFLLIITLMHWSLGLITLVGMLIMVGIAMANEIGTRTLLMEARKASEKATKLAIESGRNLEAAVSMGMMDPIVTRWQIAQQRADTANRRAGDRAAAFSSASKIFRMFMQSMLLAAGALLVIEQQISSGMMIAVSIIGGKALGPIGGAVSQWRGLVGAREAFFRLKTFHKSYPAEPRRLALPAPKGRIEARNLQITPPGAEIAVIKDVSFALDAGSALGVIGASAAGKSTLARALVGLWPPERGSVRLDGADLRMWNRDQLGPRIGYLPQTIELFDGTVAQNISRFYHDATPEQVFRAAQRVGIHEMIVDLPDGYNFKVGENGVRLSAGQRQRLGLARAVFGDPVLVVLDEPNANLDVHGESALQRALLALKKARTTVILITHRPSALDAVDHILVLEKGMVRAFGEKSKVLQALKGKKDAAQFAASAGKAPAKSATGVKSAAGVKALPKQEAKNGA